MEKISTINSIQSIVNLTSVDHPMQVQLRHLIQSQFQRQLQQQQHQQQLTPSPVNQLPGINHHQSQTNGTSSSNSSTSQQHESRNSSFASTNGRNGASISNERNNNGNGSREKNLIDLLTCTLCKGYLIDATTIDLCMHSFCRPCVLRFIKDCHRCPECNLEIKDKRFLNRLKPDVTLQSIVYKLVPGLYEKEMLRRRNFYASRQTPTPRYKSEMFGDIPPCRTIKPDDMLNISLTWSSELPDDDPIKTYLLCRADTTIMILKKLIIAKFGMERPVRIYYGNTEILFDLTALMDIATTFNWPPENSPENKVLALTFKEQDISIDGQDNKKLAQVPMTNSLTPTNPGHGL